MSGRRYQKLTLISMDRTANMILPSGIIKTNGDLKSLLCTLMLLLIARIKFSDDWYYR